MTGTTGKRSPTAINDLDFSYDATTRETRLHKAQREVAAFKDDGSARIAGQSLLRRIIGSHVSPVCSIKAGSAATGADGTITHCYLGPGFPTMVYRNEGANTTRIAPQVVVDGDCTDGLELPSTNTDNIGAMITFGAELPSLLATTGSPNCFTVGTDRAFYLEVKLGIPDVSDYDALFLGFVEPAASYVDAVNTPAALIAAYDEKAGFAINAGDLFTYTSLAGSDTATDLSETNWADDGVHTLRVNVSATGVVTYLYDNAAPGGAAAFTFADGTVVTPTIIFAKGAAIADTPPIIEHMEWGFQD